MRFCLVLLCSLFVFVHAEQDSRAEMLDYSGTERDIWIDYSEDYFRPLISVPLPIVNDLSPREMTVDLRPNLNLYLVFRDGSVANTALDVNYRFSDDRMSIQPTFPLGRDSSYVVRWKLSEDTNFSMRFRTLSMIPTEEPLARLQNFYPLTELIPENTLLFYAHFDRPVLFSKRSMEFVDIMDDEGVIEQAWTSYGMPNSSTEGRTVSFMLHPGRVKHNITMGDELGMVMYEGNEYRVVIERDGFRDSYARRIPQNYEKRYRAGPVDTDLPRFLQTESEKYIPRAGTEEAVILFFSEAMDYGSMQHAIHIRDSQGQEMAVEVSHYRGDSSWQYRPAQAWVADTRYRVEITEDVRDLAHNSVRNPFEMPADYVRNVESIYWDFVPAKK